MNFKRILAISFWTVMLSGLLVLVGFANFQYRKTLCRNIEISIDYAQSDTLITRSDIYKILKNTDSSLVGRLLSTINIDKIENALNNNAYIAKADVYSTIDGIIKIKIFQRQPIIRVVNQNDINFYIDSQGYLMPTRPLKTARVMVVNGLIKESYPQLKKLIINPQNKEDSLKSSSGLYKAFWLAKYLNTHTPLLSLVDQIYIDNSDEMELIPKVGNHLIIFGDTNQMSQKFENLILFYRKGLTRVGWDKYNIINLKFKNQVVCSKKISNGNI